MSKSKSVISWKEAAAAQAAKAAKVAVADVDVISTKGGNMMLGDRPIPNNEFQAITLGYTVERTYYDQPYNAEKVVSPVCFAMGESPDTLVPHANVKAPINPTCAGCKYSEWGSSTTGSGKGQACKERVRLAIISAADEPTPEDVAASKIVTIRTPPTSTPSWYKYIGGLSSKGLPCWGALTTITTKPSKFMFGMAFTPAGKLIGDALLAAVFGRTEEAEGILAGGAWTYEDEDAKEEAAASMAKYTKK